MMIPSAAHVIPELLDRNDGRTITGTLSDLINRFPGKIVFSTSFGMEDQLITHFIHEVRALRQSESLHQEVSLFTLDTGRLFPETYATWSATIDRYQLLISSYSPNNNVLDAFLTKKGPNSFYQSVENRKECCRIRKSEPLKLALADKSLWITGLRAEQSDNRKGLLPFEWDETHQIIKYHPLLYWSTADVKKAIGQFNIPYNPLHDRGFPSIGCAPCTRAIAAGEDFRAGRWWWENNEDKECGLHVAQKIGA